ncbi:MAG: hypothetical protein NC937_04500, partial [Candidatus Omnitrophica bacterium]|nr:hypothetical protein [Candidatus Omnitrophota bacterium]
IKQKFPQITLQAKLSASSGNPEPVRDGINRPVDNESHCWKCTEGEWISYSFVQETFVKRATLILDSGLDKLITMSHLQKDNQLTHLPDTMPKKFRIEIKQNGKWRMFRSVENNSQRLFRCEINQKIQAVKFILEKTYEAKSSCVYAFYCE